MSVEFSLALFGKLLHLVLESLVEHDPVFHMDFYQLDRDSAYAHTLKRGLQLVELCKKHGITDPEDQHTLSRFIYIAAEYLTPPV